MRHGETCFVERFSVACCVHVSTVSGCADEMHPCAEIVLMFASLHTCEMVRCLRSVHVYCPQLKVLFRILYHSEVVTEQLLTEGKCTKRQAHPATTLPLLTSSDPVQLHMFAWHEIT